MELPKSPVQTTINLLAELRNRPDGWGAIAAQNRLLNKKSNSDAEQAEAEMLAFSTVGEIIGDEDLRGEPTRVIGLGRTASQKALELIAVDGRYDATTSLVNQGTGHEQIAICVKTGRGKHTERYYFPLDDAALARFDVTIAEGERFDYLTRLKKVCRQMKDYLRSADFRELAPDVQKEQVRQLLDEVNAILAMHTNGGSVRVECTRYSEHVITPEMYSVGAEHRPLLTAIGDAARFIVPEGSEEPVLELTDETAHAKHWIRPEAIIEIMPLETGEDMQTVDLFGQWFGPEYQGVAYSLETDLAYARQSYLDDDEWQMMREEAIEELEMELPSGYTLDAIYVTGFVFVRDGNDKYTLEFCDSDMVAVDGAAFIEVREGEFRAVLSATTWDTTTQEEKTIYIVPSKDYLSRLETPLTEESQVDDIVALLQQEVNAVRTIVQTPDFYKLPLDEQREMLEIHSDNVSDHLGVLSEFFEDYSVDFRVTEYRSLPEDLLELGWDNPLVSHEKIEGGATLSIVADTFSMYNPDVEDGSRTTAFQSIDEFILSDGEPMVVLESTMTGMYYLVKARDIVHCAPIVSSDE